MASPRRYPIPRFSQGLAIVGLALIFGVVPPSVGGLSPHSPGLASHTPACAAIIALGDPYVQANLSLFLKVCEEPSFAAAFQDWGAANFSTGAMSRLNTTPPVLVVTYMFTWTGPCGNQTEIGKTCFEAESWSGNNTTGNVAGPFFGESPLVCSEGGVCGIGGADLRSLRSPPFAMPFLVIGVTAGVLAGTAGVILGMRRSRSR